MTMDFSLSEEQQMLSDMAERFCRDQDNRMFARDVDASARKDWPRFADLGWLALPFPEELGGIGGDVVDMAVLTTSLGRGYVLSPLIVTSVLCGSIVSQSSAASRLAEQIESDLKHARPQAAAMALHQLEEAAPHAVAALRALAD